MGFKCGIVGLPNVGKSTLFNALTETSSAEAANYPFCTIEPNSCIVSIPDNQLLQFTNIHPTLDLNILFNNTNTNNNIDITISSNTSTNITIPLKHTEYTAIGTPHDLVDNKKNCGSVSVYVFNTNTNKWEFLQRIIGPILENSYFGYKLDIDQDWLMIQYIDVNYQNPIIFKTVINTYQFDYSTGKYVYKSSITPSINTIKTTSSNKSSLVIPKNREKMDGSLSVSYYNNTGWMISSYP